MSIDKLESLDEACFEKFIALIYRLTGITIAKNRKSMVHGRIRKRVVMLSLSTYEEYFNYVVKNDEEKTLFIDVVTTNETYFFRTPRIWSYIENQFLPGFFQKKPSRTFSAWSAASSTGEEAHSLGIICQKFKDKNNQFNYEISGSDISHRVIEICKEGLYHGRSVESFKNLMPQIFSKYMLGNDDQKYCVHPDIKKRLKFFEHNLFTLPKEKKIYDLILIRNVFIYFTPDDQKKVLDFILPKLSNDGVLIIGESETVTGASVELEKVENLIYKKMAG